MNAPPIDPPSRLKIRRQQFYNKLSQMDPDVLCRRVSKVLAYNAEAVDQLADDMRFATTRDDICRFGNYLLYGTE
jgi:hypothetical protein